MKVTALCTLAKPAVIWNHSPKQDTDSFLQARHLLRDARQRLNRSANGS